MTVKNTMSKEEWTEALQSNFGKTKEELVEVLGVKMKALNGAICRHKLQKSIKKQVRRQEYWEDLDKKYPKLSFEDLSEITGDNIDTIKGGFYRNGLVNRNRKNKVATSAATVPKTTLTSTELQELAKKKFKEVKGGKLHWFSFYRGFMEAYNVTEEELEEKPSISRRVLKRFKITTIKDETLFVNAYSPKDAKAKLERQKIQYKKFILTDRAV